MVKTDFLLLLATVLLNSGATLLVKKGADAIIETQPITSLKSLMGFLWPAVNFYTIFGLAMLGLSFVMYVTLLSRVNVSIAQPMLALSYVLVAIGAYLLFSEPFTITKVIGIVVIIFGVYLLSLA